MKNLCIKRKNINRYVGVTRQVVCGNKHKKKKIIVHIYTVICYDNDKKIIIKNKNRETKIAKVKMKDKKAKRPCPLLYFFLFSRFFCDFPRFTPIIILSVVFFFIYASRHIRHVYYNMSTSLSQQTQDILI